MRTLLLSLASITVILFSITACDDDSSTSPSEEAWAQVIICMDSVAIDTITVTEANDKTISLIYDNYSHLLGEIQFRIYETYTDYPELEPYTAFRAIARKDSCYACYIGIPEYGSISLDYAQGFDAYDPDTTCGVVFIGSEEDTNYFWGVHRDEPMILWAGEDSVGVIDIDEDGRFTTDIALGEYWVSSPMWDSGYLEDMFEEIPVTLLAGYNEYFVDNLNNYSVEKPNIYLYPPETTTLEVNIAFPHGGEVTVSDPQYPEQWQGITVTPDGMIDGEHGYLFYEAEAPAFSQKDAGWVVAREDLEAFFVDNLTATGFVGREIDDFIEWWMPRLPADYYAIYPQYNAQLDAVIALEFSVQPDNIQRLIYAVEPLDSPDLTLAEPQIPAFMREGFVAVEWGVIRLGEAGGKLANGE